MKNIFAFFGFFEKGVAGETFLEKSFPRTPFKRLLNKGKGYGLPDCFTVAEVCMGVVRSPLGDPDLRSPSGFDSGFSPSAQDDTAGEVWQRKLEFALDSLGFQRCF